MRLGLALGAEAPLELTRPQQVAGFMHYCCWPCVCDTQDFIRVRRRGCERGARSGTKDAGVRDRLIWTQLDFDGDQHGLCAVESTCAFFPRGHLLGR